jgi:hypothetical protein
VHKTTSTDDKRLQSTLKRLGVNTIPGIEEVLLINNDGSALQFNNPKVQASIAANTYVVSGAAQPKRECWRQLGCCLMGAVGLGAAAGADECRCSWLAEEAAAGQLVGSRCGSERGGQLRHAARAAQTLAVKSKDLQQGSQPTFCHTAAAALADPLLPAPSPPLPSCTSPSALQAPRT